MSASKNSNAMSAKVTGATASGMSSQSAGLNMTAQAGALDWQTDEDLFFKSRVQIADFFRKHRVAAKVSLEQVRDSLSLESTEVVLAYESGNRSIPLEDVFALTNLLNIPPEEVLALIVDSTSQQGLR